MKWGLAKYGKSPSSEGSPSDSEDAVLRRDPFNVYRKGAGNGDPRQQQQKALSTRGEDDVDMDAEWGSAAQQQGIHEDADEAEEEDDDGTTTVVGDKHTGDAISLPPIRYPLGELDLRMKLAADFCYALSDDKAAFQIYSKLCRATFAADDPANPANLILLVSCLRSVEDPASAELAASLVAQYLARQPSGAVAAARPFLFTMLDAYMMERDDKMEQGVVDRRIRDIISGCIGDGSSLVDMRHDYASIDLVTYQCLSYGLDRYEQSQRAPGGAPSTFPKQTLLNQYVHKQPFYARLQAGEGCSAERALRACVSWCQQQLHQGVVVPVQMQRLPDDPDYRLWKEDIVVFVSLFDAMLGCVRPPQTPPSWYNASEAELGISASELLVTICWMIGDHISSTEQSPGSLPDAGSIAPATPSYNHIFNCAQRSIDKIASWSELELWAGFLDKFAWMNRLVKPEDEEEAFVSAVISCAQEYISAALEIELDITSTPASAAPSPVPAHSAAQAPISTQMHVSAQAMIPAPVLLPAPVPSPTPLPVAAAIGGMVNFDDAAFLGQAGWLGSWDGPDYSAFGSWSDPSFDVSMSGPMQLDMPMQMPSLPIEAFELA